MPSRQRRHRRAASALLIVALITGAAGLTIAALIAVDVVARPQRSIDVRAVRATRLPTTPPLLADGLSSPRSMTIQNIELWAPVNPVGLDQVGDLELPDETEVGWYESGGSPGRPGATVLAGHVTWNDTFGPFYRLRELELGAQIEVQLDSGVVRTYEVTERAQYPNDNLPEDRIWRSSGFEELVLITCGGSFDEATRRYRDNIVVYAVPVD